MDYNIKDLYSKIWTTKEGLEDFYKIPDPWHTQTDPKRIIRYNEILKLIKNKKFNKTVDIGCGEGLFTGKLKICSKNITGYDISDTAIERAKTKYSDIKFIQKDIRDIEIEGDVDFVVLISVLEFFDENEKDEVMKKILKGSRILLISQRVVPQESEIFWEKHDFSDVEELKDFLSNYGFIIKEKITEINTGYPYKNFIQKIFLLLLRALNASAGYFITLKFSQFIYKIPLLKNILKPFVSNIAFLVKASPVYIEDFFDQNFHRRVAEKIVDIIYKSNITPNQVTLISLLTSIAGFLVMLKNPVLGAIIINLSITIDCVDGQLARRKNLSSKFGDALDHTTDDITFILGSCALFIILKPDLLNSLLLFAVIVIFALLNIMEYFLFSEYHRLLKNAPGISLYNEVEEIKNEKNIIFRYYALRTKIFIKIIEKLFYYPKHLTSNFFYAYIPLKFLRFFGPSSTAFYLMAYFILKPDLIYITLTSIIIFIYITLKIRSSIKKLNLKLKFKAHDIYPNS